MSRSIAFLSPFAQRMSNFVISCEEGLKGAEKSTTLPSSIEKFCICVAFFYFENFVGQQLNGVPSNSPLIRPCAGWRSADDCTIRRMPEAVRSKALNFEKA